MSAGQRNVRIGELVVSHWWSCCGIEQQSGVIACEACIDEVASPYLEVTISGLADSTCSGCDAMNGTWLVPYFNCGPDPNFPNANRAQWIGDWDFDWCPEREIIPDRFRIQIILSKAAWNGADQARAIAVSIGANYIGWDYTYQMENRYLPKGQWNCMEVNEYLTPALSYGYGRSFYCSVTNLAIGVVSSWGP
jgi:hypothetical protein